MPADELLQRPSLLQNAAFWRQIEGAIRGALVAFVVYYVGYLSGQDFLPDANLAAIIGLKAAIPGVTGGALLYTALIEVLTGICLIMVPIGYGVAQIEDDHTWRIAFPFIVGSSAGLMMHTTLFPDAFKGICGIFAVLFVVFPRETCEAGDCDYWFGAKICVNFVFAFGVSVAVHLLPLPLPPKYSLELPLALPRVRRLQAKAQQQTDMLLNKLVELAQASNGAAREEVENLTLTVAETFKRIGGLLKFACAELHVIFRGVDSDALVAAIVRAKKEYALLESVVAVAVAAPTALLERCPDTMCALRALADALKHHDTNASEGRAVQTERAALLSAYGRERRTMIVNDTADLLMCADTLVASMVAYAEGCARGREAAAAAKPARGCGTAIASYVIFSTVAKNWKRPFKPFLTGPANEIRSWVNTIQTLKFSLGIGTAALWISVPRLADIAEGHGDWVAVNFALLTGAGLLEGSAGSWKKAQDRFFANCIALIFTVIILVLFDVTDDGALVGIAMPWIILMLTLRTPQHAYRFTCAAYTFGLAAWEIGPTRTEEDTNTFVTHRIALIAMGVVWWIGFELLFIVTLTPTYHSDRKGILLSLRKHSKLTAAILDTATTTLANPPRDADALSTAIASLMKLVAECKAASASAKDAIEHAPYEPDLASLNFPLPSSETSQIVTTTADVVDSLLVRVVDCVKVCQDADAALVAECFVGIVKTEFAALSALTRDRRAQTFIWLAAYSAFLDHRKQLSASYEEYHQQLVHQLAEIDQRSADQLTETDTKPLPEAGTNQEVDDTAKLASRLGVSTAAWAMISFCNCMHSNGMAARKVAVQWALWDTAGEKAQ